MKCLFATLVLLASSATAQTVGRLSYIEPDARSEILTRGDARRLPTGFVEVLHDARLEDCKRRNYEQCAPYEWSIPFMPENVGRALERRLSEAWNRYDARMFWRIQTELGGQAAKLINCTIGQTNFDLFLGVWDHELIRNMKPGEFCDALEPDLTLYIPTFCSLMDALTFWDRVPVVYARAYQHALTTYYPDYWKDVYAAITQTIPLALWWDGVYPVLPGSSSGLVLQPIANVPNPGQYVHLALEAQRHDLRGFAYILARYPFLNLLGGGVLDRLEDTVRRLPFESDKDGESGLAHLEELKRTLSQREGIFSRSLQWADIVGKGPEPQGSSGAATPYEYAGVGHAVFLALQSGFFIEVSPRVPIFWRVCFTESIPPVPIPVPVPMPVLHANSRVDTRWLSVPEGYPIPNVKDVPGF